MVVVIFNSSIGKDSAFALSKDTNIKVYINKNTENRVTLPD